jgi:hypothetical protein
MDKNSITLRNGTGKQLFYIAVNPNQEIITQGIVYNNSTQQNLNDNAYDAELYDTWKQGSSVHSRYIGLKKNLIYGNGLEPIDPDNDALWDWIAKRAANGMDKNDVLERLAFDMALYEGTYLQIVYDSTNAPADIYHTDFRKIRATEPNQLGFVESWKYSNHWGIVYNQRQVKGVRNQALFSIDNYNPNNIRDGRQIMQIMKYNGGGIYPCVTYNSVLPYIKLAYQLGVFELNRALQGFLPTTIVYVVGIAGEAAQQKYVNDFESNFVGVDKSKVLFMFGNDTNAAPKIEKIDSTEKEGVFEKLIDICNSQITIAHSGSMPLSGIEKSGQQLGGGDNQLFFARENFIVNEIVPTQRLILKKFNELVKLAGIDGELTIINDPLHITTPKEAGDELSRSERRKMLWGLSPLPEDMEADESVKTGDVKTKDEVQPEVQPVQKVQPEVQDNNTKTKE